MIYRRSEIERITETAIATARSRRKRLCSIDKANVLETSVLWRRNRHRNTSPSMPPTLKLSHMLVDNAAMQLVRNPNQFDVFVTENLFGDILSDEMAVICGSLGMLSSASLGAGANSLGPALRPVRARGRDGARHRRQGDRGTPAPQILSAALMLRHSFELGKAAHRIEAAVRKAVTGGGAHGGHLLRRPLGRDPADGRRGDRAL